MEPHPRARARIHAHTMHIESTIMLRIRVGSCRFNRSVEETHLHGLLLGLLLRLFFLGGLASAASACDHLLFAETKGGGFAVVLSTEERYASTYCAAPKGVALQQVCWHAGHIANITSLHKTKHSSGWGIAQDEL